MNKCRLDAVVHNHSNYCPRCEGVTMNRRSTYDSFNHDQGNWQRTYRCLTCALVVRLNVEPGSPYRLSDSRVTNFRIYN